jgi:hypothetical protein
LAHQFGVDHRVPDINIGQQTPIPVVLLDIPLEPDRLPLHQAPGRFLGFLDKGLDPFNQVRRFRRVHADGPHPDRAPLQPHIDGVAIDDLEHRSGEHLPSTLGRGVSYCHWLCPAKDSSGMAAYAGSDLDASW